MTTTDARLNAVQIEAVGDLVDTITNNPDAAATVWSASVRWDGAFRSSATVRGFEPIPSDEPAGLGGDDTAPNPVEQLLGALGNCLAVGYAANATVRGIAIDDLRIDLRGDLDLHTFLGLEPDGHAGFRSIDAEVHLRTDAEPEAVAALHAAVAATSPVGHTLQRPTPLEIRPVDQEGPSR
jgi:uncharacterized OsmC-like protein